MNSDLDVPVLVTSSSFLGLHRTTRTSEKKEESKEEEPHEKFKYFNVIDDDFREGKNLDLWFLDLALKDIDSRLAALEEKMDFVINALCQIDERQKEQ